MQTNTCVWSYFAQFLEWEVFQTKFLEEIESRILYSVTLSENRAVEIWDNV
jgi:hypothetical protein